MDGLGPLLWPVRMSIINDRHRRDGEHRTSRRPACERLRHEIYIITAPAIQMQKQNWAHPICPSMNCLNRRICCLPDTSDS
ncbi:hypothetical protein PO124_07130 [Bacillus licheniformis]|nr:hypothetical protein [Bacillus licheniformis]